MQDWNEIAFQQAPEPDADWQAAQSLRTLALGGPRGLQAPVPVVAWGLSRAGGWAARLG